MPVRDDDAALPIASKAAAGTDHAVAIHGAVGMPEGVGSMSVAPGASRVSPRLSEACARRWAADPFLRVAHHSSATNPMLVKVANWLRCRRFANASPTWVPLIQGEKAAVASKYCSMAIRLLMTAAHSQLVAATWGASTRLSATNSTKTLAQPSETSQGMTAAEGPPAKGLSQGSNSSKGSAKDRMGEVAGAAARE